MYTKVDVSKVSVRLIAASTCDVLYFRSELLIVELVFYEIIASHISLLARLIRILSKYADKSYANVTRHFTPTVQKYKKNVRVSGTTKYDNIQISLQLRPKKYDRY